MSQATHLYLLFESASGYALFENTEAQEIGSELDAVQKSIQDLAKFGQIVKLKSFVPFTDPVNALENINDISEGQLNETLKNFLQMNFPKKSKGVVLGVSEDKLGGEIQNQTGIACQKSQITQELLRGIRVHFEKFLKDLKDGDLERAQRALGHSYSRAKVKFNVHKVDNMIIQAIAILDQLDKDMNNFAMRCREWYGWNFPELSKIVPDHIMFAKLAKHIKAKENLSDDSLAGLEEITGDATKAQEILDAARTSMGTDISPIDMINIERFADRVVELGEYRLRLHEYLHTKMTQVAPNLSTLIGDQVGARLIAHAGSLTNLAKYPASTVQILGAEKALFRALKTRSNTPKYGLIYHSSFIGKAGMKNKGRISRYLANKCSIAARIDSFSDSTTTVFGEKLKTQVEERLRFYDSGVVPAKNLDVMREAMQKAEQEKKENETNNNNGMETDKKKKKKKKKAEEMETEVAESKEEEAPVEPEKKKKKKKSKEEAPAPVEEEPAPIETMETEVAEKKKKKKKTK